MGKALYRKYRSKSLAEIIGQQHITDTLGKALEQGTISHAYLFTGPRGIGKTSIARILAYEVNGLPYDEHQAHLDIIEIDAASNRRIDEIRELKERVHIAPTSAKYKVYIIDEVHMLTREAFNALLKTLEEPPEHAIFILATTEAHKVPETIISRTQRFTFKPVSVSEVAKHLKDIAQKEKIHIDDQALELIAAHGEGSFRDSIGLLDQLQHVSDAISLQHVQEALGQAPDEMLAALLDSLHSGSMSQIAASLAGFREQGIQPSQIARQLSRLLRKDIINAHPVLEPAVSLALLHELAIIPAASDPGLKLELALYGSILSHATPAQPTKQSTQAEPNDQQKVSVTPKPPIPEPKPASKTNATPTVTELSQESWPAILAAVKREHNTLYGITRMAQPSFEPGKLVLTFSFGFHHKRLSESKNQQTLMRIIKEVTGQDMLLECVINKQVKATAPEPVAQSQTDIVDLEAISNIFGSAEVVE